MASRQFATFEVADQLFGVEVHTVQEVLSYNEYTPVPLAPPAVGGLFNLRGQVIAAVDLRVQLGLVRQAMQGPVMNVILRGDGEPVSLLVDRIGEVVDLDDEAFEGPPDTLSGPTRELVTGTFKMDGRLMLALDVNQAVDTYRATT
ncbi:chemotaxis protein CheW [Actinoplanes sp. ATCC 53533]|jgi:purine-binding chemotaxis protein CheW|uniref:Chemotaxis protein CheW n=2 Tax=Actinoplanes TaxID=1865 RepID=A0A919JIP3_9ACTN|nr:MULTISPECIES: chemotaxis protein CheW [Actinoplanes]RSM39957.1 chemotaxis protein CheW [Actinoplanes sp. ATCC 53533]GIE50363.1 chemotaxis protein CheW [Actinoplanes nipponensis]GIM68346.1 chemotaxis protein CheW [Actinoplanes auranticolor]